MSNALDLNTVEASRHLSRLVEVSLLTKTPENHYVLTNMAPPLLVLYERMKFITDNADYFLNHDLRSIPGLIENIGYLARARILSGFFEVITLIKEISEGSNEFIYVISPSPMKDVIPMNVRKAKEGVEMRIIYKPGFEIPVEYKELDNIRVRFSSAPNFGLKFNESKGGIAFHTNDGEVDFSSVLVGDDPVFISYLKRIFEHHWKEARP